MESEQVVPHPDPASIAQLSQMIAGARIGQILAVAAEIGIPDLLKDGPRSDGELSEATGTHAPSLYRLMRALAALELVSVVGEAYELTPLGAALCSNVPQRLDLFARYVGSEERWLAWGQLGYSIRTGEAAFPHVFGMQSWEYAEQHPDAGRLFNELMTVGSRTRQDAILDAYDFSRFGTVVDVGGGHGQLLGALLQRYPDMRGVLFDQPHVVSGAAETLSHLGVQDRCTTAGGSFFETAPSGGDAYIFKFILHDWDDENALTILRTVHRAMASGATLLAIDRVLPEVGAAAVNAAILDLHMLVMLGGKERTESEFRSLYDQAGFRPTRVVPTASDVSLIEGIRI